MIGTSVGALNTALSAGLVMAMVGGWLLCTVIETGADVTACPKLSRATAVSV